MEGVFAYHFVRSQSREDLKTCNVYQSASSKISIQRFPAPHGFTRSKVSTPYLADDAAGSVLSGLLRFLPLLHLTGESLHPDPVAAGGVSTLEYLHPNRTRSLPPSVIHGAAAHFSSQHASSPPATNRVLITNKHGEKLVGLLHPTGSNKIVVLCHGFTASKSDSVIVDLADAITKQGISIFRFDFSGNGESEGEFQYGNYRKEADDLHSVVSYLCQDKYDVTAIVGHSKGGDVVVLYASLYDDVHTVVNLSGRFYLEKGIEERLGKDFIDRINKEGYIDVTDKSGKVIYRVTKDSLMERLNTDMRATSLSISKECSFFTIHGSADEIIPVEDAYEFAKHIPTHKLGVIDGADHCYTAHRKELSDAVVDFIMSNKAGDT